MVKHLRFELALLLLVVLTLIALTCEDLLLNQHFALDSNSNLTVNLYTDAEDSGGNSQANIEDAHNLRWRCNLRGQYAFPYCGFEILLDPERQKGIDLSNFTSIRVWLNYTGPAQTLRIYLRNYDPQYSSPDSHVSTKYNQVEFNVNLLSDYVEFSLQDFFVANWWLRDLDIPPKLSHPQFDNIVDIDIQTGSGISLGRHEFQLKRIEFIGRLMSTSDWYLCIILVWLVFILGFLVMRVIALRKDLRLQRQREHELLEANALLDKHLQQLERTAKTDFLTGTFNRLGIEEALARCLKEWRQSATPFAIILMDIDHFKKINDTWGHDTGDKVLSSLANLMQAQIRQQDLLARWGGEEFVLVCRNTNLDSAKYLAEKLRESVAQHQPASEIYITASFGVACISQCGKLDKLFKAADMALYHAKATGRNRVIANTNPDADYPSK